MNIGILTFHRAHNYGAMLQAYALKKILDSYGHKVEFVGYRQEKIEHAYKLINLNSYKGKSFINVLKTVLIDCLTFSRRYRRHRAFKSFATEYLNESQLYSKKQLIESVLDYDAVIFGSDQIWTVRFLGKFDDILWGNINLKKGKRIAYAPSMEIKSLSIEQEKYVSENINNFDAVSVREIELQHIIMDITNTNVPVVLDPTLLCSVDDYKPILKSINTPKNGYILIYQIGRHKIVREIAVCVSQILNLPIIEIVSSVNLNNPTDAYDTLGPGHFVSLIKNASFVVTSSFHGTAFAINCSVPFYSVLINGIDTRIRSILHLSKLDSRGVSSVKDINPYDVKYVDFSVAEEALDKERKKSLSYLINSIKA